MNCHSVTHAHWYAHVNGVHAPRDMRGWLCDTASLTLKLSSRTNHFRVQRLHQQRAVCLRDEYDAVGLARHTHVQEREVLLRCDGRPMVFAHTIVPLTATTSDWPFFGTLGERSLGTTLFGDPRVERGALEYARLRSQHPLFRRANKALGGGLSGSLFARRCLYRRKKGLLLVTELFLPAIAELSVPNRAQICESTR